MATLVQYTNQLLAKQRVIARKMGCDLAQADKPSRVMNLAILTLLAAVIKALTDKLLLTDAELLAALTSANDAAYDDQPMIVLPAEIPGDLAGGTIGTSGGTVKK